MDTQSKKLISGTAIALLAVVLFSGSSKAALGAEIKNTEPAPSYQELDRTEVALVLAHE